MIERSLVLLKPDAVQRSLVGNIIRRFERAGLKIIGMKMVWVDEEFAKKHYTDDLIPIVGNKTKKDWDEFGVEYTESAEEIGKMIVDGTRKYISEGPVIAMVLQGIQCVEVIRKIVGSTGPKDSPPGTIRGDFAHMALGYASLQKRGIPNLIHASANVKEAEEEIKLWFKDEELHDYSLVHEKFVK